MQDGKPIPMGVDFRSEQIVECHLPNPIQLLFSGIGPSRPYSFSLDSKVSDMAKFLGTYHYFCDPQALRLSTPWGPLAPDRTVGQQIPPEWRQCEGCPAVDVTVTISQQLFPVQFFYRDPRTEACCEFQFQLWCSRDDNFAVAISRLAPVFKVDPAFLKVVDPRGETVLPSDDLEVEMGSGRGPFEVKVLSRFVWFLGPDRRLFAIKYFNLATCNVAKHEFYRKFGVDEPSLIRLVFNNEILCDKQNLAYLGSSKDHPVMIVRMIAFSFLIGEATLRIPLAEADLVQAAADRLAEHTHKDVGKLVGFVRDKGRQALSKKWQMLRVDPGQPIAVPLLEPVELIFWDHQGYLEVLGFRLRRKTTVKEMKKRLQKGFPRVEQLGDFWFCTDTVKLGKKVLVSRIRGSVYLCRPDKTMQCRVAFADGLRPLTVSENARVSDVAQCVRERWHVPVDRLAVDGERLPDDRFLCSVLFEDNSKVLSVLPMRVGPIIVQLRLNKVIFPIELDDGVVSVAGLRGVVSERFSFSSPDYELCLGSRRLFDVNENVCVGHGEEVHVLVPPGVQVMQKVTVTFLDTKEELLLEFPLDATAATLQDIVGWPVCQFFYRQRPIFDDPDLPIASYVRGPGAVHVPPRAGAYAPMRQRHEGGNPSPQMRPGSPHGVRPPEQQPATPSVQRDGSPRRDCPRVGAAPAIASPGAPQRESAHARKVPQAPAPILPLVHFTPSFPVLNV
jgi:hypothetical protein